MICILISWNKKSNFINAYIRFCAHVNCNYHKGLFNGAWVFVTEVLDKKRKHSTGATFQCIFLFSEICKQLGIKVLNIRKMTVLSRQWNAYCWTFSTCTCCPFVSVAMYWVNSGRTAPSKRYRTTLCTEIHGSINSSRSTTSIASTTI